MHRIPLSNAQAGHVLARRVASAGGMAMMPSGTALTPALIERLERAGIQSVVIADEHDAGVSPDDLRHAFDELFAGHEHDAWMMELKDLVVRQALGQHPDA